MHSERAASVIQTATRTGIRPYRRILVPLDGTAFAEAAVRPAAEIAARAGAVLHLVGVMSDTPGTLLPIDPLPISGVGEVVDEARERESLLREVARRVRTEWGCSTTFELLSDVSTSDALVDSARRLDADLVVAATHLRGWLSRSIQGSTAGDLVKAGPFPVLLIPSEDPGPGEDTPMQGAVEIIVVAVDPDAGPDDRALAHGAHWAQLWNARLILAQAVVTLPMPAPGLDGVGPIAPLPALEPAERDEIAQQRLAGMESLLRREGIDAHSKVLEGAGAAEALLDFVDSSGADLLVVSRRGKGLWERIIEGSESNKLARRIRTAGLLVCHEGPL
jgi:nucleotide-binding universal stress UspA family protein